MPDAEAPTVVYVNANEKDKDDNSSSYGGWSHKVGGSQDPTNLVQRRLKQRHIQMWVLCSTLRLDTKTHGLWCRIAIAGTFGTGLFLNSGFVLATAGPAGALIAYILVGTVAYALVFRAATLTVEKC